ncbi:tRNA 2-selenouridine(34) synthase MnmH [Oceanispirochaeta crateris]|uniref:tRNA 2-selenouridine(34) synthase MnmH n=1 Tax=Oceanispirochaeta crateris TaxID=2518645 RepID=A0A5C1QMG3_9SPIO|nr:tRNA 2-selenouridine(34) synthase MnmH [Oceanispirochaeta crateris]QEN08697.1 tRNA 2-selenouridine(34) synthase MnmH [Oceanispirochaeta crateris]
MCQGGLRSQRFASLLDNDGYTVYRLDQGYKGYRRGAQFLFGQTLPLLILGGMTGSGKTEILKCLSEMGEQVLDLEGLAHHKGSAFGSLGMGRQPSTEQFENDLSEKIRKFSHSRRIWVEDESLSIGKIFLPLPFFEQMKRAPLVRVEMDRQNRIDRLSRDYGHESKSLLEESIRKISKRLGSESAFKSIEALQSGDLSGAVSLILDYYDKSYEYDRKLKNRSVLCRYFSPDGSPQRAAEAILELLEKSQDS